MDDISGFNFNQQKEHFWDDPSAVLRQVPSYRGQ
jgi:hypothetical protein